MSIVELLAAAFITCILLLIALYFKNIKLKANLNLAQNENQNLKLLHSKLEQAQSLKELELKKINDENIELKTKLDLFLAQFQEKQKNLEELKKELLNQRQDLESKHLKELKEQKQSLKDDYKQGLEELKKEFQSNLNKQNEAFLNQNQLLLNNEGKKLLNSIFEPVKKSLDEYNLRLSKNEIEIKTNIKNMFDFSQKIGEKADKLSQILKGDKKIRGNFAELQLKNVLENSGLQEGFHYELQEHFKSEGKSFYPDAVVRLSKDKSIIIDAKFSLPSSFESVSSEDIDAEKTLAKELCNNLKARIDELAKKPYKSFSDYDFILLFIPYQNILDLALSVNANLYQEAYNKGIFLTTPQSLFMALKTIDITWRHIQSNENIITAFKELGSFYDKFVGVMEDFTKIKNNVESLEKNISSLENKLSTGKGNLSSKFDKLKELGAKTSKSISKD